MFVISLKKVVLIFILLLSVCFCSTLFINKSIMVNGNMITYKIIVDAGHGMPDGGAVSDSGISEESINLAIASKLYERLQELGYDVVMTRTTHESIADADKKSTIREMKTSDLENRVNIANSSFADFMISIHLNKFQQKNQWGWQTFYSKESEKGKIIAELIQKNISKKINRPNKRVSLPIEGIKIVDKTNIPVIIVECGFLSNDEDLRLLQTDDYQLKIVDGIADAINEYYSL